MTLEKDCFRKSSTYAYCHTLIPLVIYLILLYLARSVESPWKFFGLVLLIGFIQYRLYFPLHDCSHFSLFPRRSENILFGNLLASTLFTSFESFKKEHMNHHKYYGTRQDPGGVDYWVKFSSHFKFLWFLLSPLLGLTVFNKIKTYYYGEGANKNQVVSLLMLLLVQLSIAIFMSRNFSSLWRYFVFSILPFLTIFLFLSRLRMFLEHGSLNYAELDYLSAPLPIARTIPSFFPERSLLSGMNFNYHHEHHLYPQVPSLHLKKIHKSLKSQETHSSLDYCVSYGDALKAIWRNINLPSSKL